MALIVEDGSGKSDAQSYVSVTDADDYHANHSASTDWSGADTADKEKALRLATQWLDATYHGRWKGVRFSADQALDWPRDSVELDGYVLSVSDLPQQLLDATCEMALKERGRGDDQEQDGEGRADNRLEDVRGREPGDQEVQARGGPREAADPAVGSDAESVGREREE
jgi:hypothetical protein